MWASIALISIKIANAQTRTTPILNNILVLCDDEPDDDSEPDCRRYPSSVTSTQPQTNPTHTCLHRKGDVWNISHIPQSVKCIYYKILIRSLFWFPFASANETLNHLFDKWYLMGRNWMLERYSHHDLNDIGVDRHFDCWGLERSRTCPNPCSADYRSWWCQM